MCTWNPSVGGRQRSVTRNCENRSMNYRAGDYIPLPNVASTLGCSRQSVYRLIESGDLEGMQLKDHGWWRVLGRSLDMYLQRRMGAKRQRPEAQKRVIRDAKKQQADRRTMPQSRRARTSKKRIQGRIK
jgi:biotin operon repressor